MAADVLARFRRIRRVDARREATGEDRSDVRDKPLRRVESDDVDGLVRLKAELDEGARGDLRLLVVLRPRPRLPNHHAFRVGALVPHRDLLPIPSLRGRADLLDHRYRLLRSDARLGAADRAIGLRLAVAHRVPVLVVAQLVRPRLNVVVHTPRPRHKEVQKRCAEGRRRCERLRLHVPQLFTSTGAHLDLVRKCCARRTSRAAQGGQGAADSESPKLKAGANRVRAAKGKLRALGHRRIDLGRA